MKSILQVSRLAMFPSTSLQMPIDQNHLVGLRGLLVIQSFLFVFFQTFLPAAVPDSKNVHGPSYQIVLRKSFSVLFCNKALIYSWIIFLSARTICLPYLVHKAQEVCASSVFRRGIRLWIPAFVAYSISAAAFSTTSTEYITDFLSSADNLSTSTPMRFRTLLIYFNSLFDIFWLNKQYNGQAANKAFPSGTLWIVSVLFQQSYTVYMTMVIIPCTRTSWRVKAMLAFILAAFWVHSWAWYSVSGLLMADAVLNMGFEDRSRKGFSIGRTRIPLWPFYATMVFTGVALQFFFISWKTGMRNDELYGHTGLYAGGMLNENLDEDEPMARVDNYLVIMGSMLLIETFEWPRKVLGGRFFVGLGHRSFSVFLVQPIVIYTAGIKLYIQLDSAGANTAVSGLICLMVCVPLVAIVGEVFYHLVDLPSVVAARSFWAWMKK
ncbi:hypothetical protein BDW02DRAFT_221951 [Decorospora gaudefroyi]|uniref:Acyltransferase 3 domain-containing protein n=1 Tax=Decorospora gaudefroyi TaxID=184978 RepID=A0A6A5KEP0_9PLEO|nr:hypothetical protein BDW02DRAFT_221951 [Decorospora gaudefroyi]